MSDEKTGAPGSQLPCATVLVSELMSSSPILIDARAQAHAAERVARASGIHHLLVVDAGALMRVVCLCDLERAPQTALVGTLGRSSVVYVNATSRAAHAARMTIDSGVGCLPVLDDAGGVIGVITRRDLRRGGFLPSERGVDLCAACGSGHHLRTRGGAEGETFCVACLNGSSTSADCNNFTLGGSG
jgi:CBS domain-containing protein